MILPQLSSQLFMFSALISRLPDKRALGSHKAVGALKLGPIGYSLVLALKLKCFAIQRPKCANFV